VAGSAATAAEPISLADAGFKEREHLQEWVLAHPEIIGSDVMIVTFEFDRWSSASGEQKDRLDVLGLGKDGRIVVAELKRGQAPDTTDMQGRDSPQTVETSVVVIMASMAGLLVPVPGRGRLVACPLFLLPGAAVVSGVKGGPQGPSPAGRCGAPLRLERRPRTLSGRKKASGGAAASFFPGPRSGPAALTRRPFPPGTARNPPGCAFPVPSACARGCSPRSTRRSRPAPRPWSRTCAGTAAPIPAWSARTR
jgi:hypothetical protein